MYLLKVIPIASKLPERYFSYFSKEKVEVGSLVEIKIRNRKIFGITVEIKDVRSEKINLKAENFSLKKIEKVLKENFINKKIIYSLIEMNSLLAVKESEILEIFLNDYLFEKIKDLKSENKKIKKDILNNNKSIAILDSEEDRLKEYLKIINKELKEKKSCVIFFPTINDLKNSQKEIEINLKNKEDLVIFHGEQSKKERQENLDKLNEKKERVFLSTPSIFPFLLENQIDLGLVIIDKENSFNYFSHSAKKEIDAREMIKIILKSLNLKIVVGGNTLSLNTFKEIKENKIKLISLKKREEDNSDNENNKSKEDIEAKKQKNKKILIFDLAKDKENKIAKYSPVYFKKEVVEKLEDYKNKKEGKIFLYTKRKGIAGETLCKDCNHILKCKSCEKPYILFKENKEGKREYMCAICKNKKELNKNENLSCENCSSWRMEAIGIGSEGLENNLKENGFKVFLIDSKNTNTKKKVNTILEAWQNEKLSILIGTDLALHNINKNHKIDFAGIISIDTLFSIPEINIDEKIVNLIIDFKEKCKTKNKLFIETRLKDAEIWKYIEENNYLGFLEKELENRKILNLPPFSNIFTFRLKTKEVKYKERIENLLNKIQEEENVTFKEKIVWRRDLKKDEYLGMIIINKKYTEGRNKEKNNTEIKSTSFIKKLVSLLSDFDLKINPQNVY